MDQRQHLPGPSPDDVSRTSRGKQASSTSKTSKRGMKNSSRRAQQFRSHIRSTQNKSRNIRSSQSSQISNSHSERLSTEKMKDLLAQRKNKRDDLSARDIDQLLEQDLDSRNAPTGHLAANLGPNPGKSVEATVVPIYGNLELERKDIDAVRFMSLNINGIGWWNPDNIKLSRLKNVLKSLAIDVVGLQETNYNFSKLKSSQTLADLLRHGDDKIQSVVSHNTREIKNIGAYQPGGVATIMREELTGFYKKHGRDEEGLGMYCYYAVEGNDRHITYFITAYAPCNAPGRSTYYQHLLRYIQEKGLTTNPKDLFREKLTARIKGWRAQGHRVVLMMDSNENITDGVLSRRLARDDIRMREAVHKLNKGRGPPTHFRGSDKSNGAIDGIWVSDDLEVIGASYLPFDHELGDHRPVVVDVLSRSILGVPKKMIVRPKARRLSSRVPRIRDKYLKSVKEKFKKHKIEEKLSTLEQQATFPPSQEVEIGMEKLDNVIEEIMLQSEQKCRIIYPAHYEFSPVIKRWLDRCHALRWLLRYHQGKNVNGGNMRRFAQRNGITNPMSLSVDSLVQMYLESKEQARFYMSQSPWLRKKFLNDKMNEAIDQGNSQEANRVKEMLRAEAQRKTWREIQRVTKPRGVLSVTRVEVANSNGSVTEYTTKDDIEKAVMEELSSRFGRASSAPICQGVLYDLLGTYADTDAAIQILEGTFAPPPDADGPTLIILEEIARIWRLIGEGEVSVAISQEDYQYYWRRVKERTSSSLSGLHFGHYKSIATDDELSNILARKLSLISSTGSAPERWARGLSVMLEKIAGVALLTKLRAILLLEADFNQHNKLIFQHRMLALARENGLVPEEIFSEKGKTAEDAILQQVLMYDIARITKRPLMVAQVDASQCYDRVAHAMAALTLRSFKVHNSSVMAMLRPLHCMEFYLRTGFGQSTSFCGGADEGKHGLAQGNGAAPATWQQISTLMINAHHKEGYGVELHTPISKRVIKQVGILYVDDTNLWAGLGENDDETTVAVEGQKGITAWGNKLIAVGGALNGDKCSVTIHNMAPDGKGSWVYTDQTGNTSATGEEDDEDELEELTFSVPQVNAEAAQIKRLQTNQAVENLGLYARPDGSSEQHFEEMREKITTWTGHIKNGVIPTRSVWMSYTHQLWAGLRYGLGACSASMTALSKGLGSSDYYLLSSLGVVRSITREWRYLPASFGGMDLFDLTTETTAATLNSFLQHYGSDTNIGNTLLAALEYLQLEIGVDDCPLHYDFDTWGHLATDSWVKALWEKVDKMGITLLLDYKGIPIPRENDNTLMSEMVKAGFRGKELKSINRVRIAQETLFVSDIATANGKYIEKHLETWWENSFEGTWGEHRSLLHFSREEPTVEDWKTWKKALKSITSGSNLLLNNTLGKWVAPSTRKWRQFYHPELNIGELHHDDKILLFENDPDDRAHILSLARETEVALTNTIPATFDEVFGGKIKLKSRGPKLVEAVHRERLSFLETLKSKGGEWMWKDLRMEEDPDWIVEALERGSLHCVTDGSHNQKLAPHVSGAAWVLKCSHSNKKLEGEFSEFSPAADSYRAEQLGMLAIHLLLLTAEEYYERPLTDARIFCDNRATILTFSKEHHRVSAGAKNNDILRVLRRIQATSKLAHKLNHVKAHQDDHLPLSALTLASQLNCSCDRRAKEAVQKAIQEETLTRTTIYRLPMEAAAVFINGIKQTFDLAKELRYQIGKTKARQFYADEKIMDSTTFDSICWEDLRSLLSKRPKMYQLWFAKQFSGFCGTGQMLSRWDKEASSKCPNCGLFETADHLTRCNDRTRKDMLRESIRDLESWLLSHCSHPELRIWIPRYLENHGRRLFVDLVHPEGRKMSQQMRRVGNDVDKIGWRHVTEGKLPISLKKLQHQYLLSQRTQITIDAWMRGLIDHLLTLSHTQWITRNLTKHHTTLGTIALTAKEDIQKEVEQQLNMGFSELPPESRCLLEISPDQLFGMGSADQQYWLNAAQAARTAANNALHISEGKSNSWKDILKMPEYKSRAEQSQQQQPSDEPEERHANKGTPSKPSPKRRKKRRTQSGGPTTATGGTSNDRTELLRRISQQEESQVSIRSLLDQPSNQATASMDLQFNQSRSAVEFTAFKTLNPGLWVKGDVVNAFAMNILGPKFRNRGVYFFSSYFFSSLLETGPTGRLAPSYNYQAVKNWGNNMRGGVLGKKEIIIPINHQKTHWLCLKASIERKSIELWDSLGRHDSNQLYLNTMKRYLKDKYQETFPAEDADEWISQWSLSDNSDNSPRQHNGYDCGIFTITNMTFLAQNVPLSSSLYSEADFQVLDTRRRIAFMLWKASSNHPQPPRSTRPHLDRALPTKRSAPTQKSTTTSSSSSSSKERNKRRRQSNQRIIIGGTRPRGKISYTDPGPVDQLQTLLNRKRSANSIAIEESSRLETSQRHVPRKRRKPPES